MIKPYGPVFRDNNLTIGPHVILQCTVRVCSLYRGAYDSNHRGLLPLAKKIDPSTYNYTRGVVICMILGSILQAPVILTI